MATTARTEAAKAATRKERAPAGSGGTDAIALLEADHREVDGLFDAFEEASGEAEKKALADKICLALKVHTPA